MVHSADGQSGPERHGTDLSRRSALRQFALAGFLAGIPGSLAGNETRARSLPDPAVREQDPEAFWVRVRNDQFLLPDHRAFLNPGSLGVMPRPVLQAVIDALTHAAEYPTDDVPRWGYEMLESERAEMAAFLGCGKDELAFTHNCTEAMNYVAGGLDLKPGDEVLTTDQEHPGGISAWRLKAARHGTTVREVPIPVSPHDPSELTDRLISAIGPRTRVLMFSGITSPTGLLFPVQDICTAARSKGVITVVDGAHMDGQMPMHLNELGCDYFAASPHKWLFAPPGSGILYGRGDALNTLWSTVANAGWDNAATLKSARFLMVGTNGRASIDGMIAGVRFLKSLGEDAVYERIHQMARYVASEARRRGYLEVVTPGDSRLYRGMVSIRFKPEKLEALAAALKREHISSLVGPRVRVSTHIYARRSDIDRYFQVCDRFLQA